MFWLGMLTMAFIFVVWRTIARLGSPAEMLLRQFHELDRSILETQLEVAESMISLHEMQENIQEGMYSPPAGFEVEYRTVFSEVASLSADLAKWVLDCHPILVRFHDLDANPEKRAWGEVEALRTEIRARTQVIREFALRQAKSGLKVADVGMKLSGQEMPQSEAGSA